MEKAKFYFMLALALVIMNSCTDEREPDVTSPSMQNSEKIYEGKVNDSEATENTQQTSAEVLNPVVEDPKNIPPKK
ncbi:hypothetical protein [Chryseobacterium phosphatilyticum]|nr:hypothetical protein [Chryseobacterium phosphatilyticum]